MSYPWGNDRRFNAYSDYFKRRFGTRVQKISIDAGFTCPNRDGNCGSGGCTFCDNQAFTPSYNEAAKPIVEQIEQGKDFLRSRYRRASTYLAYFQSYSNTYAPLEVLRERYEQALQVPGIVGLVIGTRPDCVNDEILDYLAFLSESAYLIVEYGIESVFDKTLERINRGHDVECTAKAIRDTAARGIRVGGHMIIGLPGEERSDFLEAADVLSSWPLNNLKFHQLQVIHGTAMAREYKEKPSDFHEFDMEAYLELMVEILGRLRPDLVIERIAGEVNPELSVRAGWGIRYDQVLKHFERLLEEKDAWQGKFYSEEA